MVEININCGKCRAKNVFTFSDDVKGSVTCAGCGIVLFGFRGVAGYIYVLSNPSMPGLVKIGCTTRSVEDRVRELNAPTSVPAPFKVEAFFESPDPQQDEARVHWELSRFRMEGREFFRVGVSETVRIVRSVLGVEPQPGSDARPWQPTPPARPGTCSCGLCKYIWNWADEKTPNAGCPKCGSSAIVRLA